MASKTTTCIDCKTTLAYKTKPPKRCSACWRTYHARSGRPKPKKWSHKGSREAYMFKVLDDMYDAEYINNGYYSWLKSPRGAPMQLDRYYPDLKLAFEHHGNQHFQYNKYYHKSKSQFNYLQECDRLKAELCKAHGIQLVVIDYRDKITPELINQRLKESV